eukprot:2421532-Pleurochrysis_carterae.AAC.3
MEPSCQLATCVQKYSGFDDRIFQCPRYHSSFCNIRDKDCPALHLSGISSRRSYRNVDAAGRDGAVFEDCRALLVEAKSASSFLGAAKGMH